MRLVSFYTPSHKAMFDEYVAPRTGDFDEVVVAKVPQKCLSASFKQAGWNECMVDKIDMLRTLPDDGKPTLYVDADVVMTSGMAQWAREYAATLEPDAVAYSDDIVQWCAGVMVFHSTPRVALWWLLVREMSIIWNSQDQDAIHTLRMQSQERGGPLPVKMTTIPGSAVANWATIGNRTVWAGEPFEVPSGCVAWHANWTFGVESKVEMLRAAKAQMSP